MKEIRVHIELTERAIAVDRRYCISLGDGIHGSSFVLGPKDQFSRPEWEFLVGPSQLSGEWHSNNGEGMYVRISRQYVNPNFGFTPQEYQQGSWLLGQPEVSTFRLYNPLFARPCLNFPKNSTQWGDGIPFSEGDQHQFAWTVNEYEFPIKELDVQYYVKRLGDSDDYKEFLIRLD